MLYSSLLTLVAANLKQRRLATCDDKGIVHLTELGERSVREQDSGYLFCAGCGADIANPCGCYEE